MCRSDADSCSIARQMQQAYTNAARRMGRTCKAPVDKGTSESIQNIVPSSRMSFKVCVLTAWTDAVVMVENKHLCASLAMLQRPRRGL